MELQMFDTDFRISPFVAASNLYGKCAPGSGCSAPSRQTIMKEANDNAKP
jgi:hypothetical protein